METKEIVMLKPAENLDFKFLKVKNHTSSRPSHLESQVVENKRTWLFCCWGTISSANSIARKMVLTFLWTASELRMQDKIKLKLSCVFVTWWGDFRQLHTAFQTYFAW